MHASPSQGPLAAEPTASPSPGLLAAEPTSARLWPAPSAPTKVQQLLPECKTKSSGGKSDGSGLPRAAVCLTELTVLLAPAPGHADQAPTSAQAGRVLHALPLGSGPTHALPPHATWAVCGAPARSLPRTFISWTPARLAPQVLPATSMPLWTPLLPWGLGPSDHSCGRRGWGGAQGHAGWGGLWAASGADRRELWTVTLTL